MTSDKCCPPWRIKPTSICYITGSANDWPKLNAQNVYLFETFISAPNFEGIAAINKNYSLLNKTIVYRRKF
jgi:hypothetical protein